ncbi:methionine aminotransferase [Moheibacter stercoris]|uniref:Methionine aminotransferase n=1 Tax=Moheibacter stercoris TaxID=1628251 RepID=A0ABV2LWT3_9FLAO
MIPKSKLPLIGTNIFTVMSNYANQHGAVNLSQGFPDYQPSPILIELVSEAMKKGFNQYAPMAGYLLLREEIAKKYENLYGANYDVNDEITITAGGSEAVFSVISSMIHAGDEVIIFEPAFDLYRPIIELFGGIVKPIILKGPDFTINWDEVKKLISPQTKMIVLNNPNNPATTTLKEQDFKILADIVRDSNILLLSDEVYEHIVFDGQPFWSITKFPELKDRTFVVASFGKLFHITGWKVGYVLAPKELTSELRKIHQFNVFCVNAPAQIAIAEFLKRKEEYLHLPQFFQQKRDFLTQGLETTPFKVIKPEGSYFLLADYSEISDLPDNEFAFWLTEKFKVATIPISAFYQESPDQKLVRFCFAKKEETMAKAIENLNKC